MKKFTLFLWSLPTLTFFVVVLFFWQSTQPALSSEPKGRQLPYFDAPLLSNPNQSLTSDSLKGQVTLLHFWASWCPACRNEHPLLMTIKEKYGVRIYGINYRDNADNAIRYLNNTGNPYILVGEDSDGLIADRFNIYGTPETYVIDAKGNIRYHFVGAMSQSDWEEKILPVVKKYSHPQR